MLGMGLLLVVLARYWHVVYGKVGEMKLLLTNDGSKKVSFL